VLGVVAKGATLPVLDRKRGWVQVSDAATGKTGWIYSGLLVGEARSYTRKKRAASAETKSGTNSESFWDRVGRWLTPDSSSASTQDAR
jgi:SH3-like domain-containing protein